jgi:hypothetical protein
VSDADAVKASWCIEEDGSSPIVHQVTMHVPASRHCNGQCPWLMANHGMTVELFYDHEVPGIPMPERGFKFAPWKRAYVWEHDLKDGAHGYGSLCHVRLQGTEQRRDGGWDVVSRQCSGALVMQQRELLRHVEQGESALTLAGAARVASELLGRVIADHEVGALDIQELLSRAHPSLLDLAIGSDVVAPPLSTQEVRDWSRLRHCAA